MNTLHAIVPPDPGHALDLLRTLFGRKASVIYAAHGMSVARIVAESRAAYGPGWDQLRCAQRLNELAALEEAAVKMTFSAPNAVREFLKMRFVGQGHESFVVIFLDAQNRVLAAEEVCRGTLTQTSCYPREIVKRALHHNAGAVILSHCHPSGIAEPSHADEMLTATLKQTLNLIDVKVLDHFIVAGGQLVSFAERGLL